MTVIKVAGCQLGVKNEKGDPLLKEWLIAATTPKMAARMAMECPGSHRRGELAGGGLTASTSYYADETAKGAARSTIEESAPDNSEFTRNMTEAEAQEEQALTAGKEKTSMDADPSSTECQQILRWLTTASHHRPAHPSVSLGPMPPKWKRIQAGQFEWGHPQKMTESKFSLSTDKNCKADPEGSWMSMQAAEYFDSGNVVYETIPRQARRRVALAEEATQATKGAVDRLVADNPEMAAEEGRGENYAKMYAAEQECLRQVHLRRISQAGNAKNQALKAAARGAWFKGLARVLAAETNRQVGGGLGENQTLHPGRAGPVVWLARAGRIIEVDPCQIRAASAPAREIACAEPTGGKGAPWTVRTFMNQAMKQERLGFSGHDPTDHDEELASWEGVPEPAPPLKRTRHGEPPSESPRGSRPQTARKAIRKTGKHPGGTSDGAKAARAAAAEETMTERTAPMAKASPDARAFWARQGASPEVSVEMPLAGEAPKQAARRAGARAASRLRKGKREIS
ncbi:unnamed protein product [Prorocentrum cordatum]|uniref:Uncharacterized protein n=1 Tax=Prorocentrum cordatum TaxID=2364126 RepID=A0ABN9XL52_9DINO|nr:unnamed protein product [Polarella glacialis]